MLAKKYLLISPTASGPEFANVIVLKLPTNGKEKAV